MHNHIAWHSCLAYSSHNVECSLLRQGHGKYRAHQGDTHCGCTRRTGAHLYIQGRYVRYSVSEPTSVSQLVATNSKGGPLTKATSLALLACSSPFYQFLTQCREKWLHAGSRLKIYYNNYTFDPESRKWSVNLIGAHHNEPVLFYAHHSLRVQWE